MIINVSVPKIEIIPVEVPDEMLTNIIFDNSRSNWDKPATAVSADRDDYNTLIEYLYRRYDLSFVDDYEYAEVVTSTGEIIPILEY